MSLAEIAERCGTDKGTVHSYTDIYEELFAETNQQPVTVLEIGLGADSAGGLKTWLEYFSAGTVIGLSANAPAELTDARLQQMQCNPGDANALKASFDDASIDIIVDDANHDPSMTMESFVALLSKLKVGGYYIIEDVRDADVANYFSSMGFTIHKFNKNDRLDDVLAIMQKQ